MLHFIAPGSAEVALGCQASAIRLHLSSSCRLDGEVFAGGAQGLGDRGAFVVKDKGASVKAQLHAPLRTWHSTITIDVVSHTLRDWCGRALNRRRHSHSYRSPALVSTKTSAACRVH